MRKLTPHTVNDPIAAHERASYRSASHAMVTTTKNAMPYGGTVNSCALRPVNPSPCTIVGAKSDMLENATEYAIHTRWCRYSRQSSSVARASGQLILACPSEDTPLMRSTASVRSEGESHGAVSGKLGKKRKARTWETMSST